MEKKNDVKDLKEEKDVKDEKRSITARMPR